MHNTARGRAPLFRCTFLLNDNTCMHRIYWGRVWEHERKISVVFYAYLECMWQGASFSLHFSTRNNTCIAALVRVWEHERKISVVFLRLFRMHVASFSLHFSTRNNTCIAALVRVWEHERKIYAYLECMCGTMDSLVCKHKQKKSLSLDN